MKYLVRGIPRNFRTIEPTCAPSMRSIGINGYMNTYIKHKT